MYTFIWRETKAAKEVKCCPIYLLQFLKAAECVEDGKASNNEDKNPSKWFIKQGWSLPGFQCSLSGLQRRGSKSISNVSLNCMTAVWWRGYLPYLRIPHVFTVLVAWGSSWLSWTFLFCSSSAVFVVCSLLLGNRELITQLLHGVLQGICTLPGGPLLQDEPHRSAWMPRKNNSCKGFHLLAQPCFWYCCDHGCH